MRKRRLENSNRLLKTYRIIFLILAVIILVTLLCCIGLVMGVIRKELNGLRSVDGILSFLGSIIGAIASLIVAIIALYQSKKANEASEELEIEKRRNKIKPFLQVELKKLGEEFFELTVFNHSSNVALGVYLFEYPLFPAITNHKPQKRILSLSQNGNKGLYIAKEWFELCNDGVPKEIELYFLDADSNVLSQKFQRDRESLYNSCAVEYY